MTILVAKAFSLGIHTTDVTSGAVTYDNASPFRSRGYAARVNLNAAAAYFNLKKPSATTGLGTTGFNEATLYVHFRLRLASIPNVQRAILDFDDAAVGLKGAMGINTSGQLVFINKALATVATGSSVLSINTNYYIAVQCGTSATVGAYETRINGVSEFSGTTNTGASNNDAIFFGDSAGSATHDFQVSEIVIDNAGFINNGVVEVCPLYPNADGSQTTGWLVGTGTSWTEVDEGDIDSDTTFWKSTASAANRTVFCDSRTTAGLNDASILAVQAQGAFRDEGGTSSAAMRVRSNATNSDNSNRNFGATYELSERVLLTDPDTASAWTDGGIDAIEVGATTASAVAIRVTAFSVDVAFIPAVSTVVPPTVRTVMQAVMRATNR